MRFLFCCNIQEKTLLKNFLCILKKKIILIAKNKAISIETKKKMIYNEYV